MSAVQIDERDLKQLILIAKNAPEIAKLNQELQTLLMYNVQQIESNLKKSVPTIFTQIADELVEKFIPAGLDKIVESAVNPAIEKAGGRFQDHVNEEINKHIETTPELPNI